MSFAPDLANAFSPEGMGMGMLAPNVPLQWDSDDVFYEDVMQKVRATGATKDRRVQEAIAALDDNRLDVAKRLVSKVLAGQPRNAAAINVKAEIAQRERRPQEAEKLFAKCVEIAPDCALYRFNHAVMLAKNPKTVDQALSQFDELLRRDPGNLLYRSRKADALQAHQRHADAAECYRTLVEDFPRIGSVYLNYGHALRSLGCRDECIALLRKAAQIMPERGGIWWSLASFKTFHFTDEEIRQMEEVAARSDLPNADRVHLHYSLGTGCDLRKEYQKSFSHFVKGNAIRRIGMSYDADLNTSVVSRSRNLFTPEFFREREGWGCESDAPIFVLGMQRAGSTLVEQILGSHSQVEPLGELQTILQLVGNEVVPKTKDPYPNGAEKLGAADVKALGERYLELAGVRRQTGQPRFVDKCPYNFVHLWLLRLALPNAKIIDIRRHPLGCCYANFTVSFQFAPPLSYSQTEIARFYYDYVRLMAHYDRVQPGKVHRVIYENLVDDLEGEVRRMLDFLDLPFEPDCLEYWKTERVFSSFSNDQVRRPIFREGLDRWKNYEPWLGQMKQLLGPVLDAWPNVPDFDT
jgi:tetratricopeptide (TPR) repeat protein